MRSSGFAALALRRSVLVVCLWALSCAYAFATPITFVGEDLGAGPGGPFPNSNVAAASFTTAASAIGTIGLIDFESASLGAFTSKTIAPGVTLSAPFSLSINNVPNFPSDPSLDGFNTTPGGSRYVEDQAGHATFTFASPVQFFGAYLTGLQAYFAQTTLTFSDGTSETIDALETGTESGALGAVDFLGFTDAGHPISSITLTTTGGGPCGPGCFDYIGIDDVRYETAAAAVPEPTTVILLGSGALLAAIRRKRGVRHRE